jgi:hypothetical protein
MPAELLLGPREGALLFAVFVEHQNPMMRAIWAAAGPPHRRIVHDLLTCAAGA